jgi:hypothetical protein
MELVVNPTGDLTCIYDEAIDLASLGTLAIRRASYVEPNEHGQWLCDLAPVQGPLLGPFDQRSQALTAEQAWLSSHWLAEPR